MRKPLSLITSVMLLAGNSVYATAESDLVQAVKDSKVNLSFRYRFEDVDQDGMSKDATANTLRTRLSLQTAPLSGFSAGIEFDNVTEVFDDDYNNTINGQTQYPVIADPDGSDLNQFYLKYDVSEDTNVKLGRQRINHNGQRFIGGVGWRQNEQTYDGLRFQSALTEEIHFDYAYVSNVNRIFGSESDNGDLDTDTHMLNMVYKPAKGHKLAAFAYDMDFDDAALLSNRTFGLEYTFKTEVNDINYGVHASYATQSETGDHPIDYSADYYAFDASIGTKNFGIAGGIEVLGSDDGDFAFITPLATLHKFQGFGDKFLNGHLMPSGMEDLWFKVSANYAGFKFAAIYHQFESDENSFDYGDEIDWVANYAFNKNFSMLVKYATYDADDFATDTDKVWIQMLAKF